MIRSYLIIIVAVHAIAVCALYVSSILARCDYLVEPKGECFSFFLVPFHDRSFSSEVSTVSNVGKVEFKNPSVPPLEPVQVFNEWKAYHSAAALENSSSLADRKFILADFSCPQQVGVQAADYTVPLLLAIATNRTLLFRYDGFRKWINDGQNSQKVCGKILRRAGWIPLYNNYAAQLPLPQKINASFYEEKNLKPLFDRIDRKAKVQEDMSEAVLVEIPRLWRLGSQPNYWHGLMDLRDHYAGTYISEMFGLTASPLQNQKRVHKLYVEGMHFLYGLLFFESFSLTDELLESVKDDLVTPNDSTFSFGVHARHPNQNDDGSNISGEVKCVDRLIQEKSAGRPCRAHLMSDRQTTVAELSSYVRTHYNCTIALVSRHISAEMNADHVGEHGVASGSGYFQDLAVVGQAQSGFVSKRRSSTSLVAEYMEYNRKMRLWKQKGIREADPMPECY